LLLCWVFCSMVYLLCVGFVLFFFSFFLRKKKAEKEAKRERKTKA